MKLAQNVTQWWVLPSLRVEIAKHQQFLAAGMDEFGL
jgi:hypothetical protein